MTGGVKCTTGGLGGKRFQIPVRAWTAQTEIGEADDHKMGVLGSERGAVQPGSRPTILDEHVNERQQLRESLASFGPALAVVAVAVGGRVVVMVVQASDIRAEISQDPSA